MRRANILIPVLVSFFAIAAFAALAWYAWPTLKPTSKVATNTVYTITTNIQTTNSETNTTNTQVTTSPLKTGWHYYPNYEDVRGTQQDGNTLWVATYGGVLKFNLDTKQQTWLTMANGLASDLATSIVFDTKTKFLWIGNQDSGSGTMPGVTKYDTVKNRIVKFYSNPLDATDVFRTNFPATSTGLISGANVELRQDSFTGDIWAATFRGISRYVLASDDWESYGSGAGIDFAGVRDIGFTEGDIWIFVTPNALTKGGMLSLNRKTKQWTQHNEQNGLHLDRDDIQFTTVGSDVWAVGRPNTWVDAERSRDDDVYRWQSSAGTWSKVSEITTTLLQNDHIFSVKQQDGKIVLGVNRKDATQIEMIIDPTSLATTTRPSIPTFTEQYRNVMQYPPKMDIVYMNATGGLMTSSGHLFDSATGTIDDAVWRGIQSGKTNNSALAGLRPMTCNQWNNSSQDVLLDQANELMGGSFGLYAYRHSAKTVTELVSADTWNTVVGSGNVLACSSTEITLLDTTGVWSYDPSAKVKQKIGTGFSDLKKFFGFGGVDAFYTTQDNRLGMYNVTTKTHRYVSFHPPDNTKITDLRFQMATEQQVWFTAGRVSDSNMPMTIVYSFSIADGTWKTYDLRKQLESEEVINTVQIVGKEIWVMTSRKLMILTSSSSDFAPAEKTLQEGMMSNEVRAIYPTPSGEWFASSFGLWGKIY